MEGIKEVNEKQMILMTICDFLIFGNNQDNSTFPKFEKCFQPLFNNINISFENVFKDICGQDKKYITYKRFAKAYLDYLNKKDISLDTKKFFDLLFNSIFKDKEILVGKSEQNIYSFSTEKVSSKRKCISKVQVLTDSAGEIHGINIEYDNIAKCTMHPKNIENDLVISLEMVLNNIEEESYNDCITHIFGT